MADPQLQTAFSSADFIPPDPTTPFDDPAWHDWFGKVYDTLFSNGSAFNKITMQGSRKSYTISTEQLDQDDVITVNCGWYSNYTSNSGNIIYGMASNVRRSSGNALAVGGQFSAYANAGVNTIIFGGNFAAIGEMGSNSSLVGLEINAASKDSNSRGAKWGLDFVTATYSAPQGLGGNLYNYKAVAIAFDSNPRSAVNEFCGWNVGLEFHPASMDLTLAPAWSAIITYYAGDVVSSAGVLYKAIFGSLNSAPPNANWATYSIAGGYGINNYAVGIDFSMLDPTTLGRIWSGIRLTSLLPIHFDSRGTIGTFYDGPNDRHVVSSYYNGAATNRWMEVEGTTGTWRYGGGTVAIGGGAVAALGNIVGPGGPGVAAQAAWWGIKDNIGNFFWVPIWR